MLGLLYYAAILLATLDNPQLDVQIFVILFMVRQ